MREQNKQWLLDQVNHILEPLVSEMIKDKPPNIVDFMLLRLGFASIVRQWVLDHDGHSSDVRLVGSLGYERALSVDLWVAWLSVEDLPSTRSYYACHFRNGTRRKFRLLDATTSTPHTAKTFALGRIERTFAEIRRKVFWGFFCSVPESSELARVRP